MYECVFMLCKNYGHISCTFCQCTMENDFIEATTNNEMLETQHRLGYYWGVNLDHVLFTNGMIVVLHHNNHRTSKTFYIDLNVDEEDLVVLNILAQAIIKDVRLESSYFNKPMLENQSSMQPL